MWFWVSPPLEWSWLFIGLPIFLGYLTFRVRGSRRFYLTAAVTVVVTLSLMLHYAVGVSVVDGALDLYLPIPFNVLSYPTPTPFKVHVDPQNIEKAFIVDDLCASQYRPVLRVGGLGLPGYKVGKFKLANGEYAILAVVGRKSLVLFLKNGEIIILAPHNFNDFIKQFKNKVYAVSNT